MTPDPRILEANLAALVARAYEPVVPDEVFREELLAHVLDEVTLRARNEAQSARFAGTRVAHTARRRPLRYAAGFASLAAAVLLAMLFLARDERGLAPTLHEILDGGSVAWRPLGDPDEAWRARALDQALPLGELPFDARTPARAGSQIVDDAGRSATLGARAGTEAARDPDGGVAFALGAGALELAAGVAVESAAVARAPALRLAAGNARLHLEHGLLRAERRSADASGLVNVFLASGAAWATAGGARVELVPGSGGTFGPDGFVPDARPRSDDDPLALAPDGGSRAAVAGSDELESGPAKETTAGPASKGNASIVLTVLSPAGGELSDADLQSLRVSVLRQSALPGVNEPVILRPAQRMDGTFAIGDVKGGTYFVDVAVEGLALWKGGAFELAPGAEREIVAQLEPSTTVRGTVVDPDGRPVAGAWVVSEHETPEVPLAMLRQQLVGEMLAPVAVTDASGRFALELGPGLHLLRAAHADHAPGWAPLLTVQLGVAVPEPRIALQCGGTFAGRVERVDGTPWVQAVVLANLSDIASERPRMSFSAMLTDAEGRYSIGKLPPGGYALLVLGSEEEPANALRPEMRLLELPACGSQEVDFTRAFSGARVFGRMTAEDGTAVGGMGMSLLVDGGDGRDTRFTSITSPDGGFEFFEVPPGSYSIYLTPDQGRTVVRVDELVVEEWSAIERNVVVSSTSASGVVLDGGTGAPLPYSGVVVLAIASPDEVGTFVGRMFTDGEGRFGLPHLAPGYYRLIVFSMVGDYGQEYVEDVLPPEDGRPIEVKLHPGGRLNTRVVDENGAPVAGAELVFVNDVGVRAMFGERDETDAEGRYIARGVKPGAWTVRASAAGRVDAEGIVVVRPNEEAALQIVLAAER